ncbi:hypothetical protein ABZW10_13130 [Kitasatospora sp. NPDC004723]|uniref:hypothetical protein n=1 Tax=Kitasatospora sp. NPDC004723 TaxID=3154288 RepID=UPI0033B4112F
MGTTERLWAAVVLTISCLAVSGCSGGSTPAADTASGSAGSTTGSAAEDIEAGEFASGHLRNIVESVYISGTAGLRGGQVFRPEPGKPLTLSPCRLEQPQVGVQIADKDRAGVPAVPVPALYELRVPAEADGLWVSVYVLARDADKTKVLTDLVTAGRACEPRKVTSTDHPATATAPALSTAPVLTTAGITSGPDGPGVAVLSRSAPATSAATTPPRTPGWTIGPDGRLAPDGDLLAASKPGPAPVDYGEAVFYGTSGRVLVEVVKVGKNHVSTSASETPAAEEAYPAAQRALAALLGGFKGLPD